MTDNELNAGKFIYNRTAADYKSNIYRNHLCEQWIKYQSKISPVPHQFTPLLSDCGSKKNHQTEFDKLKFGRHETPIKMTEKRESHNFFDTKEDVDFFTNPVSVMNRKTENHQNKFDSDISVAFHKGSNNEAVFDFFETNEQAEKNEPERDFVKQISPVPHQFTPLSDCGTHRRSKCNSSMKTSEKNHQTEFDRLKFGHYEKTENRQNKFNSDFDNQFQYDNQVESDFINKFPDTFHSSNRKRKQEVNCNETEFNFLETDKSNENRIPETDHFEHKPSNKKVKFMENDYNKKRNYHLYPEEAEKKKSEQKLIVNHRRNYVGNMAHKTIQIDRKDRKRQKGQRGGNEDGVKSLDEVSKKTKYPTVFNIKCNTLIIGKDFDGFGGIK